MEQTEQTDKLNRRLYTLDAAAKMLHVSRQTVSAYVHSGRLGAVKVGRRWLFTQEALQNFLDTRTNWNATHTGGRPIGTTKLAKAQRLVDSKNCVNESKIAGFVDKESISLIDGAVVFALQDKLDKVQEVSWLAYVTMYTKHVEAWATYLQAPIRQKIAIIGASNNYTLAVRELQTSTMTWNSETDGEPPAALKDAAGEATEKDASPDS